MGQSFRVPNLRHHHVHVVLGVIAHHILDHLCVVPFGHVSQARCQLGIINSRTNLQDRLVSCFATSTCRRSHQELSSTGFGSCRLPTLTPTPHWFGTFNHEESFAVDCWWRHSTQTLSTCKSRTGQWGSEVARHSKSQSVLQCCWQRWLWKWCSIAYSIEWIRKIVTKHRLDGLQKWLAVKSLNRAGNLFQSTSVSFTFFSVLFRKFMKFLQHCLWLPHGRRHPEPSQWHRLFWLSTSIHQNFRSSWSNSQCIDQLFGPLW